MIRKLLLKLAIAMVVLIIAAVLNRRKADADPPAVIIDHKDEPPPPPSMEEDQDAPEESVEPDDLTQISGIGPKISGVLQDAGITSYAQLADVDEGTLNQIMQEAGIRLGNPASWLTQAQELAS